MKKRRVFNQVPLLEDWVLDKQIEKQIRFLKAVHPQLEDMHWNEGRIELRPVKRDKGIVDYLRSYGTWHIGEKDIAALKIFLQKLNGKGVDLYFSAFAFDYNLKVLKENGKKYEKGKINNENALFTSILPMDFDNITEDEFLNEKRRLLELGIETIDIFSGHGYQSFILLSHSIRDKEIFKKFTTLMLKKGYKVDDALQDPARVLRMPYTFNCKALDKSTKYYDPISPKIVATTDVFWTEKRYHIVEVFEKLNSLPDVIKHGELIHELEFNQITSLSAVSKLEKSKPNKDIAEVKEIKIESLKSVYNMLDFEKLPTAIQKMLSGTQETLRNKVMFFLIPFLRNTLGLNIETIKEIMLLWGERCSPSLDSSFIEKETDRIFSKGFKGKHGKYTDELIKAYGYLDFEKYTKKNKVIIPNAFFEDYGNMPDGAVRIYLSMRLALSKDGVKALTKKDLQRYAQVSERTIERNIKFLVLMNYVSKRKGCRRNRVDDVYYLNPYFGSTEGFTMLDNAVVKLMLKDLTDGEIKLYSYLSKIVGGSRSECWTSQKFLAHKIGKKGHSSISKMTDSLQQKGFITKKTIAKYGIMHSAYNLNY